MRQIIDGALPNVGHKHTVQMAAADADGLGDVVHRDVVGIVELDILDGGQHILAAGGAHVGHGFAGRLHQVGHKDIEVAGHQGLALGLRPAGQIDVVQRFPHGLGILATVYRLSVREGRLLHQLIGAGPIEAYPIVLPRVCLVRRIGDQLVGLGQKQIALLQGIGRPVDLVHAAARHHQVDEVMVAHAGAPGVARLAVLMPAVEDGQLYIIGVALLIGLLGFVIHDSSLSARCRPGTAPPCLQPGPRAKYSNFIIAGDSSKVHKSAVKKCLLSFKICYTKIKNPAGGGVLCPFA